MTFLRNMVFIVLAAGVFIAAIKHIDAIQLERRNTAREFQERAADIRERQRELRKRMHRTNAEVQQFRATINAQDRTEASAKGPQ